MKTRSSALESALDITEVLENILLHMRMKDLLLAQRVSRTWRDTITN